MSLSYAVVWHEPPHEARSGKLELAERALRLVGTSPDGGDEITEIPYRLLERTRVATAPGERMGGRPTLVVERRGGEPVEIASVGGIGVVSELAEHISRLLVPEAPGSWALVLLPIRDGKEEQVRALLEQGPPFEPERVGLRQHHAFVADHHVVFLFEAERDLPSVRKLLSGGELWRAAAAWRGAIAGPPLVSRPVYSWSAP
jgi:hypothetical protein